jgi:hypothetical protein
VGNYIRWTIRKDLIIQHSREPKDAELAIGPSVMSREVTGYRLTAHDNEIRDPGDAAKCSLASSTLAP